MSSSSDNSTALNKLLNAIKNLQVNIKDGKKEEVSALLTEKYSTTPNSDEVKELLQRFSNMSTNDKRSMILETVGGRRRTKRSKKSKKSKKSNRRTRRQ